ncbi:protein disulfide isomerase-like 5-1 [Phalaenopsis equestris]|uniref:protein disulfide isomerase-like 5-1 n=1 Tax=Phalaenopsis equestris TaxID=78828 RepID=UPI0009E52718|nr:protein disulfide isomerase-like 5-1 [Phalaenopsis equestris]
MAALRRGEATGLDFRRPSYVFLFLALLTIAFHRSGAEVVTLTADTFTDKIKEKDTVWFVKFCVPWCKYCNKLGTLWEELGKAVEAEDEIEVGEVDCSLNKAVCTKVHIYSYPTFKIFYDGEEFAKYQGQRDVESLKSFVLKEADKATKTEMEDEKDEL